MVDLWSSPQGGAAEPLAWKEAANLGSSGQHLFQLWIRTYYKKNKAKCGLCPWMLKTQWKFLEELESALCVQIKALETLWAVSVSDDFQEALLILLSALFGPWRYGQPSEKPASRSEQRTQG